MADTLLKATTRHIRLFTARVEEGNLVADPSQLTLDVDPDNEFIWEPAELATLRQRFQQLVDGQAGADLNDYNLRRIGSELEGHDPPTAPGGQTPLQPQLPRTQLLDGPAAHS